MSFSFTDIPRFVSPDLYRDAIERILSNLQKLKGVVSVYQVGGINTPGISDIDLFVVFEDDAKVDANPIEGLSAMDQYLFTHNLFGTSVSFAKEIEGYTCFGKYKLLFGKEIEIGRVHLAPQEEQMIRKQVALEYLVKAFITSHIEHSYHTIKLRNLFLHAKALLIDLSFLGIDSGELYTAIHAVMDARNKWFEHRLKNENLNYLVQRYHTSLHDQLKELLIKEKFYLPLEANLRISRNIELKPSETFSVSRNGVLIPGFVTRQHRKIPNLLNRLNRFVFQLPVHRHTCPDVILNRHDFIAKMTRHQQSNLPHFIPTAFGLNIFSGNG